MTDTINQFDTHVRGFMKSNLTHEEALSNWCMGLAGETGEFIEVVYLNDSLGNNMDAAKKELGDLFWYFFALCSELDFDTAEIHEVAMMTKTYTKKASQSEMQSELLLLSITVGKLVDRVKKKVYHNKTMNWLDLKDEMCQVYTLLLTFCQSLNTTYEDVMQANIDKLQKRHEGKTFNADVANQNKLSEGLGVK